MAYEHATTRLVLPRGLPAAATRRDDDSRSASRPCRRTRSALGGAHTRHSRAWVLVASECVRRGCWRAARAHHSACWVGIGQTRDQRLETEGEDGWVPIWHWRLTTHRVARDDWGVWSRFVATRKGVGKGVRERRRKQLPSYWPAGPRGPSLSAGYVGHAMPPDAVHVVSPLWRYRLFVSLLSASGRGPRHRGTGGSPRARCVPPSFYSLAFYSFVRSVFLSPLPPSCPCHRNDGRPSGRAPAISA